MLISCGHPDDHLADGMGAYSIAQAKAHLSALVEQVERGEAVTVTKRGKPVARIVPIAEPQPKKKVDLDRLRAFRAAQKPSVMTAAAMIRRMRDEDPGW